MSQYITDLQVSLNEGEENVLRVQGFTKIDVDLNKGAGADDIYLWYKKGLGSPVTRIQLTFIDKMIHGLNTSRYKKINKDLNAGAGGDYIYLWFYHGSSAYDIPIVDLAVTTEAAEEAQKFNLGWEKLACDLNRKAGGKWIYLWVKRKEPTYICDITATDGFGSDAEKFDNGFIRVDEDTRRDAGGHYVFIWYRLTTNATNAIKDLQVSTNHDEYNLRQNQNYQLVNMNLNQGSGDDPVYLWYRKDDCSIKTVSLVLNMNALEQYHEAGVRVIKKPLNIGGATEYLCLHR